MTDQRADSEKKIVLDAVVVQMDVVVCSGGVET